MCSYTELRVRFGVDRLGGRYRVTSMTKTKLLGRLNKIRKQFEDPANWTQGLKARPTGLPTCLGIALTLYNGTQDLWRCFERANGLPENTIIIWNDKPGRTHKEIIDALDKTIKHVGEN